MLIRELTIFIKQILQNNISFYHILIYYLQIIIKLTVFIDYKTIFNFLINFLNKIKDSI